MAAIDDTIGAIGVVIDKNAETQQAHVVARAKAEEAMTVARALGAEGVVEAIAVVQDRMETLASVLAQAGMVADEVMKAAQAAKT